MGKPRHRPGWADVEKGVKIICMICNEIIKVILDLHGVR
jgi:hypothetical protein